MYVANPHANLAMRLAAKPPCKYLDAAWACWFIAAFGGVTSYNDPGDPHPQSWHIIVIVTCVIGPLVLVPMTMKWLLFKCYEHQNTIMAVPLPLESALLIKLGCQEAELAPKLQLHLCAYVHDVQSIRAMLRALKEPHCTDEDKVAVQEAVLRAAHNITAALIAQDNLVTTVAQASQRAVLHNFIQIVEALHPEPTNDPTA